MWSSHFSLKIVPKNTNKPNDFYLWVTENNRTQADTSFALVYCFFSKYMPSHLPPVHLFLVFSLFEFDERLSKLRWNGMKIPPPSWGKWTVIRAEPLRDALWICEWKDAASASGCVRALQTAEWDLECATKQLKRLPLLSDCLVCLCLFIATCCFRLACFKCSYMLYAQSFSYTSFTHSHSLVSVCWFIKGLLHPKIKMLSLFTYPHVVPNP